MDATRSTHDTHDRAIEGETARQRESRRAIERREAMTTEEREIYLSRRRNYYQRRQSRLTSGRQRGRFTSGQLQTIPLRSDDAMNLVLQREPLHIEAPSSSATHSATTNISVGVDVTMTRSFVTPLPYNSFVIDQNNNVEGSSSTSLPHSVATEGDETRTLDEEYENLNPRADQRYRARTYPHHNVARNYREGQDFRPFKLQRPENCCYCRAKLFQYETKNFCCNGGKIDLPAIPVPPELRRLFTDNSAEGKIFRKNIRAYNHIFSFTSMGVQLDESITRGQGVFAFRAHGSIYHRIGTLLPSPGIRPRYLQLFIYDTEHETENRLLESDGLNRELIDKLKQTLDACNPFVKTFRHLAQRPDLLDCKLVIKERPADERQYVLPSMSQVADVISGTEEDTGATNRDIIVQTIGGQLLNVNEFSGYYDPLQYPLFLPYGTYGWDTDTRNYQNNKISCCDYYAYMLQIRMNNPSILLYGGRLLQQYVVDNFVKIETQKLRYIRTHQDKIRAELYQGLQDCLDAGENDARNTGRRTVLPSSFIGGPRDMYQRYQDAMAIVQKYGKPDIFLTMTCNPNWKEIQEQLFAGQTAQDRPDLMTRIFRAKYEELKNDIYERGVLGKVAAHVHVVEFQKRGMPHVHMLVILDDDDKFSTPDAYDAIVRVEIPIKEEEPMLYDAVLRHMIHGPCGLMNPNAPCMKEGTCEKEYPKQFAETTLRGNDSYPVYRRRDDNRRIALDRVGDKMIDNRWVVPYNPWLLLKYDCHINVEICSSIKSVKYLYKYVYKGPDCVAFEVRPEARHDEVRRYVDGRWICAPEALWKIYKFPISRIYPSVVRLQLHLPNMQQVRYNSQQQISDIQISDILNDARHSRTMLTEFFRVYGEGTEVNRYLYTEFPRYYRWMAKERIWQKRKTRQQVIGRLYAASPNEGERFYLRILLNHVRGPKSFRDLLTVNGVPCLTFRQAAEKLGILEEDDSIRQCLIEARQIRMPSALRRLFATILVFCEPTGVRRLWDENYSYMIEDYPATCITNNVSIQNRLLNDINSILLQHKTSLKEFDLPQVTEGIHVIGSISRLVDEELSIPISEDCLNDATKLNAGQKAAFDTIKEAILRKENAIFFVDGPGGTGKIFLYRVLLSYFRNKGLIIFATATSGIAATQLPGGRTAHSKLKIPFKLHSDSYCSFSKQSEMSKLMELTSAIIWDETPMADRKTIETLDRTLRFTLGVNLPFAGKVLILGGDFRQVVPVVVGGTRLQSIKASIVESDIWPIVRLLRLTDNVIAQHDQSFSDFLLRVGNGQEPTIEDDMIRIPDSMAILWEGEESIDQLINFVYPNLSSHNCDAEYMMSRALITPKNDDVGKLNDKVINVFQGEDETTYYSFDSVADDTNNLFLPEFLNSLSPGNLPPHKLTLKKGCPIMLLRNIDPKIGLCNGTRLICHKFGRNFIDVEVLNGDFKGTRVFLPRIPLKTADDAKMPFELTRKQFPVRLSFALTINKSQGQTIPHVGIFLPDHVFSHGQLYVALSRGVSQATTKVLVKNGIIHGHEGVYTRNVVYPEIFARMQINQN